MHIENAFLENLFYLYREYRRVKKTTAGTKMKQHLFLKEIRRLKFKTNTLHLVPLSNKNNNKLVPKNYSSTLHSGVLDTYKTNLERDAIIWEVRKKEGGFIYSCLTASYTTIVWNNNTNRQAVFRRKRNTKSKGQKKPEVLFFNTHHWAEHKAGLVVRETLLR